MKYTLTISPDYQPEWGLRQMFREFVANALDAQMRSEAHHVAMEDAYLRIIGSLLPV